MFERFTRCLFGDHEDKMIGPPRLVTEGIAKGLYETPAKCIHCGRFMWYVDATNPNDREKILHKLATKEESK